MADDRELKLKVKVDDDASRPLDRIGNAADDTTKTFDRMNAGLKRLDAKVADTTKTIKGFTRDDYVKQYFGEEG